MELVNFTCEWPYSQLDPFGRRFLQVRRKSLGGLVCHSARSQIGRMSLLKFLSHANFCRARQVNRGGRAQVVGRSLIGRKALQVSQRSVASVSRRSGRGCCRKSLLLLGQLNTFCFLVCQSLSNIDVNASLRSDDKSFTTARESKKSKIFQLVNRS